MSLKEVFGIGSRLIAKNISLFKGKTPDKGSNEVEISMAKAWHQNLDANSYDNSKSLAQSATIWKQPAKGWNKLNFDGVAKGNLGRASIGGLIRAYKGNYVVGYSEGLVFILL